MKPAYQIECPGVGIEYPGSSSRATRNRVHDSAIPEPSTQDLVVGQDQQLNLSFENGACPGDSAGIRLIPLTQGYEAIVDADDYEELSRYRWFASVEPNSVYARRTERIDGVYTSLSMHRQLLGLGRDDPRFGDHENRNGLDNRRSNLRISTNRQNQHNRAPRKGRMFKCIHELKDRPGYYRAYINIDGKQKQLGTFPDPISAAKAYDQAALQYFGEFARLNFPLSEGAACVVSPDAPVATADTRALSLNGR